MLHEELLETVDSVGNLLNQQTTFTSQGLMNLYAIKALRAVVELHKPFHDQVLDCVQCKVEFPCPTIQAIEKELE